MRPEDPRYAQQTKSHERTHHTSSSQWSRLLATDAKASTPAPAPIVKNSGAGFFQRLSSFLVGAGLTALVSQYYIYQELVAGNAIILKKQMALEKRLDMIEKKKK